MKFIQRADKITISEAKTVSFSAPIASICKISKLRTTIFSVFYNILPQNFAVLPILRCSFELLRKTCLDPNLMAHTICLFIKSELYSAVHSKSVSNSKSCFQHSKTQKPWHNSCDFKWPSRFWFTNTFKVLEKFNLLIF